MTLELAELTKRRGGIVFRLVGENPLNSANTPDPWEKEALLAIDDGAPWVETFDETTPACTYRYIEPLIIDGSCLSCHTPARGYAVGMRKGGLSVSIPAAGFDRHMRNVIGMLSALALVTLAVALAVLRVMLKDLRSRLDDANANLRLLATTDALTGIANQRTMLVRIGGEEFLLIAPDTTTETAAALAERVLDALRSEPCTACSRTIRMTASAGVAGATPSDEDAEALLGCADHALYEAKRLGRDQVHVTEK